MYLRFSLVFVALAAVAAQAALPLESRDYVALLQRQEPGTPLFDCHSNCGNALAGGRVEGHCSNATWTASYEACLKCALQFDIWKHYGNGLTKAASACSLTPTPSPASGSATATSAVSGTGAAAPTTTPPPTGTAASGGPASTGASTAGASAQGTALLNLGPIFAVFLGLLAAL